MAAGLAALDVLDRDDLMANAAKMGDLIGRGVTTMIPRFEFLKEFRWRGLMTGIEFGPPKSLSLKLGVDDLPCAGQEPVSAGGDHSTDGQTSHHHAGGRPRCGRD